jgi:Lon protease-like protein
MRMSNIALLSVLSVGSLSFANAFAPASIVSRGITFSHRSTGIVSTDGINRRLPSSSTLRLAADEEDDEEDYEEDEDEPLSRGVDSVGWLPSVSGAKSDTMPLTSVKNGNDILPLFPLGGIVYTPNSEHVLNIFEPRYRQMYNDILMNGSKRFVVSMSHPTENGSFAEMGVLFVLEDLNEVSEVTGDQVKYICNHRVTGRVKIKRILNPEAWENRDTYLKVEGTIYDDSGRKSEGNIDVDDGAAAPREENALKESFADLVKIQHDSEEDVRFTRTSVNSLAIDPGAGESSLWHTVQLWQNYAEQRLVARQNDLQQEFQEKLLDFLQKEKGLKEEELPSAIGFADLSPALQAEVQELQKRIGVELKPLMIESTLTMQKILEAEDHKARCNLLRHFIDSERKRLSARNLLRGMFSGSPIGMDEKIPESIKAETLDALEALANPVDDNDDESVVKSQSIFTDDEDAFQ